MWGSEPTWLERLEAEIHSDGARASLVAPCRHTGLQKDEPQALDKLQIVPPDGDVGVLLAGGSEHLFQERTRVLHEILSLPVLHHRAQRHQAARHLRFR